MNVMKIVLFEDTPQTADKLVKAIRTALEIKDRCTFFQACRAMGPMRSDFSPNWP